MRESYLKGVVDFTKWTNTVTIGAILWVSNTQNLNEGSPEILAMISLTFLILSLFFAIIVVYFVLQAWSTEWTLNKMFGGILQLAKLTERYPLLKPTEDQIKEFYKAFQISERFQNPEIFNRLIAAHIFLTMFGLFFYVLSL